MCHLNARLTIIKVKVKQNRKTLMKLSPLRFTLSFNSVCLLIYNVCFIGLPLGLSAQACGGIVSVYEGRKLKQTCGQLVVYCTKGSEGIVLSVSILTCHFNVPSTTRLLYIYLLCGSNL
jgi:hypothetical protein